MPPESRTARLARTTALALLFAGVATAALAAPKTDPRDARIEQLEAQVRQLMEDHQRLAAEDQQLMAQAQQLAAEVAALKTGRDIQRLQNLMSTVFAGAILLFALCHWLPGGLVLLMLAGAGMMGTISCTNTYVQTHVAENMRSRVISYYVMAFQGTIPIGALLVGLSAQHLGTGATLAIQGAIGLAASVAFALHLRKMREKAAGEEQVVRA